MGETTTKERGEAAIYWSVVTDAASPVTLAMMVVSKDCRFVAVGPNLSKISFIPKKLNILCDWNSCTTNIILFMRSLLIFRWSIIVGAASLASFILFWKKPNTISPKRHVVYTSCMIHSGRYCQTRPEWHKPRPQLLYISFRDTFDN